MSVVRNDVDTSNLLSHVEACFENPDPRTTIKIFGKEGKVNRDHLWYADFTDRGEYPVYRMNTCKSPYTHKGLKTARVPLPMPQWLRNILDELSIRHGLPQLNHVVLHRYIDGADTIGLHKDKCMDIHPESTIVIVSIGATRAFRLGDATFPINDGDTILIPYQTNLEIKHGVPKRARCGMRYSITARTICTYSPDNKTYRVV